MVFIQSDIRITKTHSALAGTLLEMLGKKRFCKITVNDICRNAMVSRSTFYMHFEDKYQLLHFCMQKERERLENALLEKDVRSLLYAVLKSVKERQRVYHNLFRAEVNTELIQMFLSLFRDFFSDILTACRERGTKLDGPVPLLASFYANGFAGMMMWWIEQGCTVSEDDMVLCQYNLLSDLITDETAGE